MNATPAVFQAQRSNDALQLDASASSAPQASRADGRDFAKALSDAGPKPGRKNTPGRHQDAAPSGSALPPPGNQPPPANTVQAAGTAAQAPKQAGAKTAAGAAGIVAGAPAVQSDAAPLDSGGQAVTAGKAAPAQAALNITDPAAVLMAGPMPAGADALAPDPALTTSHAGGIHTPPPPAPTAPPAAAPPTPAPTARQTAAPPVAAAISANPRAGAVPAQAPAIRVPAAPVSAAESKAAVAAATSGPSSPDTSTASNGANADAAATAVLASAAGPASRAPSTDSSPSDTSANPDNTAALQGTAAANDSPPPMPAAVVSGQALAAPAAPAITAAAAASAARAAVGSADSAATDKHSHDNGADSPLSAASNDGTAGAALLLTSNAPGDSLTPTFKVAAGVDTPDFGQGVADRVSLMMDSNLTTAKLQVNPPSLGPIEVRIALQAGHAQVWLSSHSALTRDALESSSPKLREMLGAQGFAQVSVDISQRSFQERLPQSQVYESAPSISGGTPAVSQAAAAISRTANGLLDAYA
jgi:flagellar hook-length control protein FliK